MSRAAVPKAQRTRNSGISLPGDLIRRAAKLASTKRMSLSALTRALLLAELNKANSPSQ